MGWGYVCAVHTAYCDSRLDCPVIVCKGECYVGNSLVMRTAPHGSAQCDCGNSSITRVYGIRALSPVCLSSLQLFQVGVRLVIHRMLVFG